jgi:hypothetical protein
VHRTHRAYAPDLLAKINAIEPAVMTESRTHPNRKDAELLYGRRKKTIIAAGVQTGARQFRITNRATQ